MEHAMKSMLLASLLALSVGCATQEDMTRDRQQIASAWSDWYEPYMFGVLSIPYSCDTQKLERVRNGIGQVVMGMKSEEVLRIFGNPDVVTEWRRAVGATIFPNRRYGHVYSYWLHISVRNVTEDGFRTYSTDGIEFYVRNDGTVAMCSLSIGQNHYLIRDRVGFATLAATIPIDWGRSE